MGESIEHGTGQTFVVEDLGPLLERQVRRNNDAGPLIGLADDVEQQFRSQLAGRNVPQFIKDEQVEFRQLAFQPHEVAVISCFHQLGYQFCDTPESHLLAALASGDPQYGRAVRLTRTGISQQDYRFSLVDVLTPHQFSNQLFVNRGLSFEIVGIDSLNHREVSLFDSSFSSPFFPIK